VFTALDHEVVKPGNKSCDLATVHHLLDLLDEEHAKGNTGRDVRRSGRPRRRGVPVARSVSVLAAPHFCKSLDRDGRGIRVVAESLGHASVTTTMTYTRQSALDQVREYGKDGDHDFAT